MACSSSEWPNSAALMLALAALCAVSSSRVRNSQLQALEGLQIPGRDVLRVEPEDILFGEREMAREPAVENPTQVRIQTRAMLVPQRIAQRMKCRELACHQWQRQAQDLRRCVLCSRDSALADSGKSYCATVDRCARCRPRSFCASRSAATSFSQLLRRQLDRSARHRLSRSFRSCNRMFSR